MNQDTHLSSATDSIESITDRSVTVTVPVFVMVMSYLIKSPGLVPVSPPPSSRVVLTITARPDARKRGIDAEAVAPVVSPNGALANILQDDGGMAKVDGENGSHLHEH